MPGVKRRTRCRTHFDVDDHTDSNAGLLSTREHANGACHSNSREIWMHDAGRDDIRDDNWMSGVDFQCHEADKSECPRDFGRQGAVAGA